ncbi:unnamed protein product [Spirodela intermedia]|uniref:Uncharacterized protein n=1 Tax=Spirodela intermedia TaxID=51605 RepID=A0A7I8IQL0_SPIIN|nr:unnamed protein product [Spirodela intermedia]CAA6659412.1 unnamed protein product [Spirodela intermedia]
MEKNEIDPTASNSGKKFEPAFAPEWLKTGTTAATTTAGSSNQTSGSSLHSDDHGAATISRNKSLGSGFDHESPRPSVFVDRSSMSYRRSYTANGSFGHDKDISAQSRPSSSFGRNSRERDWEKDIDFHDKDKFSNLENGIGDVLDNMPSRSEKDMLRRSQSMITGRASNAGNGTSGIGKASFEREFPHLGAEDKQGPPEIGRVSSPGVSSAVQSIPLYSSAIIGGDGWTSALAEMPVTVGGNGTVFSSVQQMSPAIITAVPSTGTGLNMAEALVQTPFRTRASPKVADDTQRLEELAIKKSRQLIPVTPSSPKTSVNFAEKLKSKGSRVGDLSVKVGQQPLAQPGSHPFRGSSRSDVLKTPQIGNFQVLNREKNGVSPTARDGASLTSAFRGLNPVAVSPSAATAATPPMKSPRTIKANGKSTGLSVAAFGDKKSVSHQNRSDFFNSLRKKTSESPLTSSPDPNYDPLSTLEKSDEQMVGSTSGSACHQVKDAGLVDSGLESAARSSGDRPHRSSSLCEEKSSCFDPAEEERLLRLFGWKEDAGEGEEALTAEEIDAFIEEYEKLRPSSKFCHRNLRLAKTMLTDMGGGASC